MNRISTLNVMGALLGAAALERSKSPLTESRTSYNGIKNTMTKAAKKCRKRTTRLKPAPWNAPMARS